MLVATAYDHMTDRAFYPAFLPSLFIMEGAAARQDGKLRERCPYPEWTDEKRLWLKGWDQDEAAGLIIPRQPD